MPPQQNKQQRLNANSTVSQNYNNSNVVSASSLIPPPLSLAQTSTSTFGNAHASSSSSLLGSLSIDMISTSSHIGSSNSSIASNKSLALSSPAVPATTNTLSSPSSSSVSTSNVAAANRTHSNSRTSTKKEIPLKQSNKKKTIQIHSLPSVDSTSDITVPQLDAPYSTSSMSSSCSLPSPCSLLSKDESDITQNPDESLLTMRTTTSTRDHMDYSVEESKWESNAASLSSSSSSQLSELTNSDTKLSNESMNNSSSTVLVTAAQFEFIPSHVKIFEGDTVVFRCSGDVPEEGHVVKCVLIKEISSNVDLSSSSSSSSIVANNKCNVQMRQTSFTSSPLVSNQQEYRFTFAVPGVYAFNCDNFVWMTGSIEVMPLPSSNKCNDIGSEMIINNDKNIQVEQQQQQFGASNNTGKQKEKGKKKNKSSKNQKQQDSSSVVENIELSTTSPVLITNTDDIKESQSHHIAERKEMNDAKDGVRFGLLSMKSKDIDISSIRRPLKIRHAISCQMDKRERAIRFGLFEENKKEEEKREILFGSFHLPSDSASNVVRNRLNKSSNIHGLVKFGLFEEEEREILQSQQQHQIEEETEIITFDFQKARLFLFSRWEATLSVTNV